MLQFNMPWEPHGVPSTGGEGDSRCTPKKQGFVSPFFILVSSLVKCRHFYLTSHINTNPFHKYNWSSGLSKEYIASPLTEWAINSIEFQHIRHNIRQRLLILILNPIAPFSFLMVWFWCLCCWYYSGDLTTVVEINILMSCNHCFQLSRAVSFFFGSQGMFGCLLLRF